MTRSNAREVAVHLIYEIDYTGEDPAQAIETRMDRSYYSGLSAENDVYAERPSKKQMDYIRTCVTGVCEHAEELDALIAQYAVRWNLHRISRLTKAAMRLAIYEMRYVDDVPNGVAINECVELTRKYEDAQVVCERHPRLRGARRKAEHRGPCGPAAGGSTAGGDSVRRDAARSGGGAAAMRVLAFDTSNYTTSVASFDGTEGHNISRLLDVEQGALGLRQSDALFAHVKRLPELADRLFSDIGTDAGFEAVGVSTRPRAVEGSYMPCFLAGESQARVLGAALGVPVLPFSHQQGHIAASLWGSGHMELMDEPHLAWHLSGGTTELLRVTPEKKGSVHAEKIGGTTDISAGQLIDRTGKLLGLPFPSGKHIDALSRSAQDRQVFRVKVQETTFSLSGVQNKVEQYHAAGNSPEETAGYALRCLIGAIVRATENALLEYPGSSVVFAGGVASNTLLRSSCASLPAIFCPPQFATDNALGVAVLTWRALHG